MSQHEKTAWWSWDAAILIWLFLLMRFTDGWQHRRPARRRCALATYIQMIVLWIVASRSYRRCSQRSIPQRTVKDERDRAIDALGDRWEGYVVVIAVNVLIVHALARGLLR